MQAISLVAYPNKDQQVLIEKLKIKPKGELMNYFSDNPRDIGITVIGGLTGHGDMTQAELDQKIEDIKESLRAKKPLIKGEFGNIQKSDDIDYLKK